MPKNIPNIADCNETCKSHLGFFSFSAFLPKRMGLRGEGQARRFEIVGNAASPSI